MKLSLPSWIQRLLRRGARRKPHALSPGQEPAEAPPEWALALTEATQKSSRAQTRLGLRLEDLERKLEGGFEDLRHAVGTAPSGSLQWENLLDAMDALDEVARAPAIIAQPGMEEGLRRVLARLERFLSQGGLERVTPLGACPDGHLFRVVGTQNDPLLPEGAISRVVRAAALRGKQVVREGEVLINRRAVP